MSLRSYRILLAGILAAVCLAAGIAIFVSAPKSPEADTVQAGSFAYFLKEVDGRIGALSYWRKHALLYADCSAGNLGRKPTVRS